jgi:hypothetical protein
MLEVTEHTAKIQAVTNIGEKHGSERRPGVSIKISMTGKNTLLDGLGVELRHMLYKPAANDPDQLDVNTDALVELRAPSLRKLAWAKAYAGYQVRFIIGATGREDILLNDVDIKKIAIVPIQGGSVTIEFSLHANGLTVLDQGKLSQMVQCETTITLKAPEIEQSSLLDEEQEAA